MLYNTPGPPSASALSAVRGLLSMVVLLLMVTWRKARKSRRTEETDGLIQENNAARAPPSAAVAMELALWNVGAQGLLNVGLMFTTANRG
eukprot:5674524-Lingulodinium_polyedra.AAC.1